MIGAMPAVAIRHERQKHRQQAAVSTATSRDTLVSNGVGIKHVRRASRPSRPTHLPLKHRPYPSVSSITSPSSFASTPFSSSSTTPLTGLGPGRTTPGAGPTLTARQGREALTAEEIATDYCCNEKFPLLHFLVISALFGFTLLIVGLVQLKPNADSEAKKYLFLGSSGVCFLLALFFMLIRYIRLRQFRRKNARTLNQMPKDDSNYSITFSGANHDRESPMDSTALLQQRF